jgi:hypothetical protein
MYDRGSHSTEDVDAGLLGSNAEMSVTTYWSPCHYYAEDQHQQSKSLFHE